MIIDVGVSFFFVEDIDLKTKLTLLKDRKPDTQIKHSCRALSRLRKYKTHGVRKILTGKIDYVQIIYV